MQKKSSNIGVTYGLIGGLALVMFGLLLYLSGVEWFLHPIAFTGFLIPVIVAILGGIRQRKVNGGNLSFADALKVVFLIFVISSVVSTAFNYVLFNFVDVPFREALTQAAAEKTEELMTKFGAKQEQIDQAVEETLKGNNYTLGKMSLNMAFGLIFWFIISLIIAAIIKKNKPDFPFQDAPLK